MPGTLYMSTEHLREYFADLYEQGRQTSTISIHYRALQQFYKWAVGEGERPDNPLERIPSPKLDATRHTGVTLAPQTGNLPAACDDRAPA